MILKQEIKLLDKKTGKVALRNTFDCSAAIEMAREASEKGGRGRSNTVMPLGFIPPEMWNYVPWLMEARKARAEGNMVKFQQNIFKFFKLYPQFAVLHTQKYYPVK